MKIEKVKDTYLDHREYLEFINDANVDNDDWVPFDSVESLGIFLFSHPDYDANRHLVVTFDEGIVADLLVRTLSPERRVAEIQLNITVDWRSKGLGERLLSTALETLDECVDVVRIILSKGNREILPFAEQRGFKALTQIDLACDLEPIEPIHIPVGYEMQPMQSDQLAAVNSLRNHLFGVAHRVEELKTLVRGGVIQASVIVVASDGGVVGYCIAQKDTRARSKEGTIVEIGVEREYRRRGIGEAVLQMSLDWLRSVGCNRVTVSSRSSNVPALRLYEKTGFKILREKEKILEKRKPD